MSPEARRQIDALFIADLATRRTPWNDLKMEPGRPTRTHLKELIARERWLSAHNVGAAVLADVPAVREARPDPESLPQLEALLETRIAPLGVLDALTETVHWLNWTRFFGPLSGFDAKLEDPLARYLATVFCYGCQIGPAQLARALDGLIGAN